MDLSQSRGTSHVLSEYPKIKFTEYPFNQQIQNCECLIYYSSSLLTKKLEKTDRIMRPKYWNVYFSAIKKGDDTRVISNTSF